MPFADRARHLGDSDFVDVPLGALLDRDRAEQRRAQIDPNRTLPPDAYGSQVMPPPDDGGTSHLSVVDADRNVVALTTTINLGFGAMLVAGDTGILLNNEMDDFSAQPGVANAFGLIGAEANAVAAGKRPLSSMSPTIVFSQGQPVMTAGGNGGPAIITATLQVLLNLIEFEMTAREAVEVPRIHHQWMPPLLFAEPGVVADVRTHLAARGHTVAEPPFSAAVQAIVIAQEWLLGASDPRKAGRTLAY